MGKLFERAHKDRSIDANHPSIDHAVDKLAEDYGNDKVKFEKDLIPLFERKHNCKVVMDDHGISGYVFFKSPKLKTHFLLKYGS